MNKKESAKEVDINDIYYNVSRLMIESDIQVNLLFGICERIIEKDELKKLYTLYVDRIEEACNDILDDIDSIIDLNNDPGFILRQKMDLVARMGFLKANEHYIGEPK